MHGIGHSTDELGQGRRVMITGRVLGCWVVLILLLTVCGWGQTSVGARPGGARVGEPTREALQRGAQAYERGELEAARLEFSKAVHLTPRLAAGHSALGAVLLAESKAAAAAKELEIARRLAPQDELTLLHLAMAYSATGEYERSVEAFRSLQAVKKAASGRGLPNEPVSLPENAVIAVATALSRTGQMAEAETILRRSLADEGAGVAAGAPLHDALGAVLAQGGRYPEARAEFEQSIALAESAAARFHLGSVALETGVANEAVPELERAHALEPANVGYGMQLAEALSRVGEDGKAVELLRGLAAEPLAVGQAVEVKYRLALALQGMGKVEEAVALFGEVVKLRPRDAAALTNAGLAQVQMGDAKGAVELYLRALALSPRDATLDEDLGVAYLQQSDLAHAMQYFRAGLAIEPENAQLHYDLGLGLKLKDDVASAIPEFERAAALDASLPDPPYTLGVIYMQQARFADAARSLEHALELRSDNGDAWAMLGSVYKELGEPEKALVALRRAITLVPQQPSPHITLAAVLAAQGKKEEAAEERKTGAALTRVAVNRQKADFGMHSGAALMNQGRIAEAIVQFRNASQAMPDDAAAHAALGEALMRSGQKVEGEAERRKAEELRKAVR